MPALTLTPHPLTLTLTLALPPTHPYTHTPISTHTRTLTLCGIQVTAKDRRGRSALHHAAASDTPSETV